MQIAVNKVPMPKAKTEPKMLMGFDYGDDIYHLMLFDFENDGGAVGILRKGDDFVARISLDALADFSKSARNQALSDGQILGQGVPAFVPNRSRFVKRNA